MTGSGSLSFVLVSALVAVVGAPLSLVAFEAANAQSSVGISTSTISVDDASTAPSKRQWEIEWRTKFGGLSTSEGKDHGAAAGFEFNTIFEYHLVNWASLHLEPRIELYSGRLQERFESDEYRNKMRIGDSYVSLKPIPYFEFRAGAIGQDNLPYSLLISHHRTFPGAMQIFSSETHPVQAHLITEQTVPTSYTLNDERESQEPVPVFQTQTLVLANDKNSHLNWESYLGHYTWSNLPDKVAFVSSIAGNTVVGSQQVAGSKFAYGFDGLFWGAQACYCDLFGPFGVRVRYLGLQNRLAPSEAADGQMWGFGPTFRSGNIEAEILYNRYFLESDATVADYAKSKLGYTNRMGDYVRARVHFIKQGFVVKAEWSNAVPVADRPTQNTLTNFILWLETDYARF